MFYASGLNVFRSTNEGQNFSSYGQLRANSSANSGVTAIAIHPTNPNILLAGVAGSDSSVGLYRSTNGGGMWDRLLTGGTIGVRFNPYNPGEAWAGDCCGNLSVSRSTNSGESWTEVRINLDSRIVSPSAGPMIFSLPNNPSLLFTGTNQGFLRSENGGASFARRGTYTPWAAASVSLLSGRLLTREATSAQVSFRIRGAEDARYTFSEIVPVANTVPWIVRTTISSSTVTSSLSARTLAPGHYSEVLRIAITGAPNSPLEVPVEMTATSEVRNSYFYAGPLDGPTLVGSLGTTPSGNLVYSTGLRILELPVQGPARLIAGGGSGGDGGRADQANLSSATNPVYSPQGELFFAERTRSRIRRVSRDGIITTVAGGGTSTPTSGLNPTAVRLGSPEHIAIDATGNLVFADTNRLWRIANNELQLLAGGGFSTAGGTIASGFSFSGPQGLAIAPDGRIFFTLSNSHAIFVLENNRVLQFAGNASQSGQSGDGGTAFLARFRNPSRLALGAAGDLFVADNNGTRIRRIRPDGRIEAVMGIDIPGNPGLCAVAESAPLSRVDSLLVRGRTLLYADGARAQQILLLPGDTSGPVPNIPTNGIVHAASFAPEISPGALFSIFGERLAAGQLAASAVPWPTLLGSTAVCLDGHPVPLFFANPTQLNGQAPYEIRSGETGYLRVFTPGGVSEPLAVNLAPTAPGIFQYGESRAIAVNPDGRLNSPSTPVAPGQTVVVYLSGTGALDNPVRTAQPAPSSPLSRPTAPVSAAINGQDAPILFLGLSPGFIGLAQANLTIPNLAPGDYELIITIGTASSPAVRITIG